MLEQTGRRLRLLREYSGSTRVDVLREVGCSANSLWTLESGKQKSSFIVVANLCKFYKFSIDLLLWGSDNEFSKALQEMDGVEK